MERTYTIPLRRTFLKAPTYHRTNRAVKQVRDYLKRHMKTEDVKLGEELNKALWARGDSKPPARVTVFVKKEENVAYAELVGKEFKKKDFSEKEEKAKPKRETRGVDSEALKEAADVKPKKEEKKEEKAEAAKEEKPAAKKAPAKKAAKK